MKAIVEAEIESVVHQDAVGASGKLSRTTSESPPAAGVWLSETGAASGHLSTTTHDVQLPQPAQTQRRLLAIAANLGKLQLKRYSRMPGGFEWAGGIPPQAIDIRTYLRPPVAAGNLDDDFDVFGLFVDTGTPIPDEYIRVTQARDGAYVYVLGEERSDFEKWGGGADMSESYKLLKRLPVAQSPFVLVTKSNVALVVVIPTAGAEANLKIRDSDVEPPNPAVDPVAECMGTTEPGVLPFEGAGLKVEKGLHLTLTGAGSVAYLYYV